MNLIIDGDRLIFKNNFFLLEDLYTPEFFKYSDSRAVDYYNKTYFVNELFVNFIQNFLALEKFIMDNKISYIDTTKSSNILLYYVVDIAKTHNLKISRSRSYSKYFNITKFYFHLVSSYILLVLLMIKIPQKKIERKKGDIAIIRTPSLKNKIEHLNLFSEIEDPYSNDSLYKYFKLSTRLVLLSKSFFESFSQYAVLKNTMKIYLGCNSKFILNSFYGKRLVHLNLYKNILDSYMKSNDFDKLYTSNNLDRFAVVEEELAKKHNVSLVGIPHGLEYGFKFPKCFTGDVFYVTSKLAVNYFNNLYKTTKFIFDEDFITSIFRKKIIIKSETKIVYFSEPREGNVNHQIISGLLPFLKDFNVSLKLKLHPKEKQEEYQKYNLEIIEDFNEAIIGNICFSRKSTILLEALYNDSISSAILINQKDKTIFSNFPSLQIKDINQAYNFKELANWIIESHKIKKT
jgi:hypothetical protein